MADKPKGSAARKVAVGAALVLSLAAVTAQGSNTRNIQPFKGRPPAGEVRAAGVKKSAAAVSSELKKKAAQGWEAVLKKWPELGLKREPRVSFKPLLPSERDLLLDEAPDLVVVDDCLFELDLGPQSIVFGFVSAPPDSTVRKAMEYAAFQLALERAPPIGSGFFSVDVLPDFFTHVNTPAPESIEPADGEEFCLGLVIYAMGGKEPFLAAVFSGDKGKLVSAVERVAGLGTWEAVSETSIYGIRPAPTELADRLAKHPTFRQQDWERFVQFMKTNFNLDPSQTEMASTFNGGRRWTAEKLISGRAQVQ